MPVDIFQYGGYTKNYAGDCCVIGHGAELLMIDLGRDQNETSQKPKGTQATQGYKAVNVKNVKLDVIVTHFHSDHVNRNESKNWRKFVKLNAIVHHGATVEEGLSSNLKQAFDHNTKQYSPLDNGSLIVTKTIGEWSLNAFVIVPNLKNIHSPTENDASLGVLIELSGFDKFYSFLTLGDMTIKGGDDAVTKVLKERGYIGNDGIKNLTYVKLSHHGSENNFLPVLDQVIDKNSTILISGYTMTKTDLLKDKLEQWAPKKTLMLFDQAGWVEFELSLPKNSPGRKALDLKVSYDNRFHTRLTDAI